MIRVLLTILLGIIFYSKGLAQFSPPGLGKTNVASWLAVGVKQFFDKKKTISLVSYFGVGRMSSPDDYNLFNKQSICVVNGEGSLRFKKNWKYSVALSYRWQNRYKSIPPYESDTPGLRQELRVYNRISYFRQSNTFGFALTYRPEIRFFYHQDFSLPSETMQFRSRLQGKVSLDLNSSKTQKLTTTAEALFSSGKNGVWESFDYKEARFCFYYTITLLQQKITFNIGYMNDLLGKSSLSDVHYLAFDMVINNPFKN